MIYIPSLDAKDLYIANNFEEKTPYGYKLTKKDGTTNYNKFINSFDYSLDLIELREIAKKIYKKQDSLSFEYKGKEYSSKIINVTFKYSVKEFNNMTPTFYVKNGFHIEEDELEEGVLIRDGELIAIKINTPFYNNRIEGLSLPSPLYIEHDEKSMTYTYRMQENRNFKTVKTAKQLREWIYKEGFLCNGIKFRRFKRSSGSARVGKCLFIDERLYPDIHKSEQCGLDFKDGDPLDLAAFEAYISLPTSSIIGTINIEPKNFLIIDDYDSVFKEEVVCTELGADNWLQTSEKEMTIKNSIWDGQSLIDISLMGEYADKGMLLLRNKFFKSCCFNTNIQLFFEENNITSIEQLNGKTIATDIKDIKVITTPSSIKFYKFGEVETWFENIYPYFGVVKFDKNTHYFEGRLVQAHYQLMNTLQLSREEVKSIAQEGLDYLSLLNTNPAVMRDHLKFTEDSKFSELDNVLTDKSATIYKMLQYDCGVERTDMYRDFRNSVNRSYLKNMRRGHILLNGTYATLFGNPYEMLRSSIGTFDGESVLKPGEVHNIRFDYGIELLGSRSPHVTMGNVLVTKNVECFELDRYFNLTPNIICINSINENILERLSGAD